MKEKFKGFCFLCILPLIILSAVFFDSGITNGYEVMLLLGFLSFIIAAFDFAMVLILGN